MSNDLLAPFSRKLARLGLAPDEQAAVLASISYTRRADAGEMIAGRDDPAPNFVVLLDGLAARFKSGLDGERQILAFCIAGDFCTVQTGAVGCMDHDVAAITSCVLAVIPRASFAQLLRTQPELPLACWRASVADAAVEREWLFNLGRRPAAARLAHLLCEMHVRLEAAELASGARFRFPVTQSDLADATGLSTVHVNRSLQALRHAELISWRQGQVTVLDRDRLRSVAGFEEGYLSFETDGASIDHRAMAVANAPHR